MKQMIKISVIAIITIMGMGCNDLYTELFDQKNIPIILELGPFLTANLTARRVYGQSGNFSSNSINNGGVSADSLFWPQDVAVDATGVYIADYYNNRVLYYLGTSTTASRVYGQSGGLTTMLPNNGGLSADSLYSPAGVAVDANGVYIADAGNNRVLYYSGTETAASRVYGQGGSFTANTSNNGGVSAESLNSPVGVAVDASGVYIADAGNNRVLYYSGTETTASRVYGQGGSFTTNAGNNGGVSAGSLSHPNSISVDANGVYISDRENNRVLYYSGTSTTASRVYGQFGSFITNTANNGDVSANSLFWPNGVEVDANGVYISDYQNNRVLYYSGKSTTASRVYGQSGSFTTNAFNNDGISAGSLGGATGLAVDKSGLYIVDGGNNRVLWY
jgi:hypothetical protein